jgi:protein TonB
MIFPVAPFYFLENRPVPANISYSGVAVTRFKDRPWLALSFVLCAHLAVFAALLRPQPQPLSVETTPASIMVSLLSAPPPAPQKPTSPARPIAKAQKPINKQVKTPVSKPVVAQTSQPAIPASMPVAATDSPVAEQENKTTNSKAVADAQPYQSPNFNAAYLNNPAPNYPSVSRRLGEQGLVLLLVQVMTDGTAGSVALKTGSGSIRLDQAALEAVKKWQFIPAKRGDQPVSASVVVPVRFSLEG